MGRSGGRERGRFQPQINREGAGRARLQDTAQVLRAPKVVLGDWQSEEECGAGSAADDVRFGPFVMHC